MSRCTYMELRMVIQFFDSIGILVSCQEANNNTAVEPEMQLPSILAPITE
jgi:hypothetical protein